MPVRVCAYAARPFPGVSPSGATNRVSNKDPCSASPVSRGAATHFSRAESFRQLQIVEANIGQGHSAALLSRVITMVGLRTNRFSRYSVIWNVCRSILLRPHRLARPRTPPFHGDNRGSNPLGDATIVRPEITEKIDWFEGSKSIRG